jgi:hypothetical protein
VDKAQVHWSNRSLLERIAAFEVLECGGGGNCFFLSMGELLRHHQGLNISAGQMRERVADYIRDTPANDSAVLTQLAEQLALIGEEGNPLVRTLSAYADHIRRPGEHASAKFELPIVAALFNLRVRLVYQQQGDENGIVGAEMRDCWVAPPSELHMEAPLELHVLLLNRVSCRNSSRSAGRRVQLRAHIILRCNLCYALSASFRHATGKLWCR